MNPNFLTAFHRAMQKIEKGENDLFWGLYLIQHNLPENISRLDELKKQFKNLKLDKCVPIKRMVLNYYRRNYWYKFGCGRMKCKEGIKEFERRILLIL
jgi:hypothetical protein